MRDNKSGIAAETAVGKSPSLRKVRKAVRKGKGEGPAQASVLQAQCRDDRQVLSVNKQNDRQHNKEENLSLGMFPPAFYTRRHTSDLLMFH